MTGMIAGRETACTQTADKSSIRKNTFRKKKIGGCFCMLCQKHLQPMATCIYVSALAASLLPCRLCHRSFRILTLSIS